MSVSRSSELRRKESWAGLLAAPPFFFLALTCSGTRNRARSSETQDKVQMCLTLRREIHAPQIPANLQQHPQEASPRQFGLAAVPSEGGPGTRSHPGGGRARRHGANIGVPAAGRGKEVCNRPQKEAGKSGAEQKQSPGCQVAKFAAHLHAERGALQWGNRGSAGRSLPQHCFCQGSSS